MRCVLGVLPARFSEHRCGVPDDELRKGRYMELMCFVCEVVEVVISKVVGPTIFGLSKASPTFRMSGDRADERDDTHV